MIRNKLFAKILLAEGEGKQWREIKFSSLVIQDSEASISEVRVTTMDDIVKLFADGDEIRVVSQHIHKEYFDKKRQLEELTEYRNAITGYYEFESIEEAITKLKAELENYIDHPRIVFEGEMFMKYDDEDSSAGSHTFSAVAKQGYYKRTKSSIFLNGDQEGKGFVAPNMKSMIGMRFSGYPMFYSPNIELLRTFNDDNDSIKNTLKQFLNSFVSLRKESSVKSIDGVKLKKGVSANTFISKAAELTNALLEEECIEQDLLMYINMPELLTNAQTQKKTNDEKKTKLIKEIKKMTENTVIDEGVNVKGADKISKWKDLVESATNPSKNEMLIYDAYVSQNSVKKFIEYGLNNFFTIGFNYAQYRIKNMLSGSIQKLFMSANDKDPDIFSMWKVILDMFSMDLLMFKRVERNKFVLSKILTAKKGEFVDKINGVIPSVKLEEYNKVDKGMFLLKGVYDAMAPFLTNVSFTREVSYVNFSRNAYKEYTRYMANFYYNNEDGSESMPLISYASKPLFVKTISGVPSIDMDNIKIFKYDGSVKVEEANKGKDNPSAIYNKAITNVDTKISKPVDNYKSNSGNKTDYVDVEALKGVVPLKVDLSVIDAIGFNSTEYINKGTGVALSTSGPKMLLDKMMDGVYGERIANCSCYLDVCKMPGLYGTVLYKDDKGAVKAYYGKIASVSHSLSPSDGSTSYQLIWAVSEEEKMFSMFETVGEKDKLASDFVSVAGALGHPDASFINEKVCGNKHKIVTDSSIVVTENGNTEKVRIKNINVSGIKDMFYEIESNTDFDTGVAIKMSFLPVETEELIICYFKGGI